MTFLFSAALLALPLAAVPILLHLLFRRRSPIVPFSTLRFVKMSVRHTAARRRLRQWLLLSCRTLLLLLLIAALAQPAWRASGAPRLGSSHRSALAALVVDTSYSMLLQQNHTTLLDQADAAARSLLRNELAGAKVALFTSAAPANGTPIRPRDAAALADEWAPLQPQPAPLPLIERIAAANQFLADQPADSKQLLVISDFQAREFPRSLAQAAGIQTILLDLHPDHPHSAGVTAISLSPAQPLPGVGSEATVELTGQPADSRAVNLKLTTLDGATLLSAGPTMVSLDAGGHGATRFPLSLAGQPWTLLSASLTASDDMPWDNTRSQLLQVPPKQSVALVAEPPGSSPQAERFVRLALDPSEGALAAWPLAVQTGPDIAPAARSIIALLSAWPSSAQATAWRDLARSGGSVVLLLRPGLEATWPQLPATEQSLLLQLLPSALLPTAPVSHEPRNVAVAAATDPLLQGLADDPAQWSSIVVRAMLPLASPGPGITTVLQAAPLDPTPSSRPTGLLFRKTVGAGTCFTLATLPDDQYTNFATRPAFLPLLVRVALTAQHSSTAPLNAEIGQPLTLPAAAPGIGGASAVQVETPGHEIYRINRTGGRADARFVFDQTAEPGIYTWRAVNSSGHAGEPVALTNLQLPAAESDLAYRPAESLVPDQASADIIIAHSLTDLQAKLTVRAAPRPQWSLPIAVVMFLLCIEALLGSGMIRRNASSHALPGGAGSRYAPAHG